MLSEFFPFKMYVWWPVPISNFQNDIVFTELKVLMRYDILSVKHDLTDVSKENTTFTFRAEMPRRLRQHVLPKTPGITHRTTGCHDPKHNNMYNPT
jgi:hypothetical protein